MAHAGMTRGAFYAHFDSKQDLYAQSIASAELFSIFSRSKPDQMERKSWIKKLIEAYLSKVHVQKAEQPCPLAFLVTDVAVNEPEARMAYTEAFLKMNGVIQSLAFDDNNKDKEITMAVTAMMIGGVAIARTLNTSVTKTELLNSCRSVALGLMGIKE